MAIPAAFTASSDSASTPPLPNPQQHRRCVWVNGPVIVGAGPSGLAVAACLHEQGVPYVILERADCVASLWQRRTYDRLKLHLPKRFCQLPGLPIPDEFPEYPTRDQFVAYLEDYARKFEIAPRFRHSVRSARREGDMWRVVAAVANEGKEEIKGGGDGRKQEEEEEVEYMCQWVVVATGENAEPVVPEFEGSGLFPGKALHACEYRSGEAFRGEKVLVIGCGNSGMEVCLDLCIHGAKPYMVVRDAVHVLPRDILGKSTFELSTLLSKHLPLCLVDKLLVLASLLTFGSMTKYGLRRPEVGPLELKQRDGKTPVLDLGAMGKIKSGEIQVVPGITRFTTDGVQLSDGRELDVDSVVFATGYRSNVPWWLQDKELFGKDGYPKRPFPNGWKGEGELYSAGFTKRGLAGAAMDAIKVAEDISRAWKEETMRATTRRTQQQHQHRHGDRQRTCISHA